MSNDTHGAYLRDTEELQRLQITSAKVIGCSVNKGERGRYYLFNSDGSTLQGGSVTADDAWRVFLHTCKWGISADANRELLEWLVKSENDEHENEFQYNLVMKLKEEGSGITLVEALLATPLDVLRVFVAATTEGTENG